MTLEHVSRCIWWAKRELNTHLDAYEACAFTIKLLALYLERTMRFELTTFCLEGRSSTAELRPHFACILPQQGRGLANHSPVISPLFGFSGQEMEQFKSIDRLS